MPRHVLFVERPVESPLDTAMPPGWRVTRAEDAELALFWLRHTPPDLILIGTEPAGLSPAEFARAVKCDHDASTLPLVQVGDGSLPDDLSAEPDAWVETWS